MARILPERDFGSDRVLIVAGVVRVFAGHEHGARRGTNWRGPRIAEKDSVIGQLLEVRHGNGTAVRRQLISRDVVSENKYNVRPGRLFASGLETKRREKEEDQLNKNSESRE
jgi:hypothetical protein